MDEKTPPKFEVNMSSEQLNKILTYGKLTLICTYDCDCFEKEHRSSQTFDLLHIGRPITAYSVVDFLKHINYDPICKHKTLRGFAELYGKIRQPIFT